MMNVLRAVVILGLAAISLPETVLAQDDAPSTLDSIAAAPVLPAGNDGADGPVVGDMRFRGWFAAVGGASLTLLGGYIWVTLGKCFWPVQIEECKGGSFGGALSVMFGVLGAGMLITGVVALVIGVRILRRAYGWNDRYLAPVLDASGGRLYTGIQLAL